MDPPNKTKKDYKEMLNIHTLNFLDVFLVPEDTMVTMLCKNDSGWSQALVKVEKHSIGRVIKKNEKSTSIVLTSFEYRCNIRCEHTFLVDKKLLVDPDSKKQ
jgi:hypothetical protein